MNIKQITVSPTVNNNVYSVTITDPGGCTLTQTITIAVHTLNNLPPWMDGINGTGDYTIYVNQGNTVSFTSTLYNDNPSEVITYTQDHNIPSSFSALFPPSGGRMFFFTWTTSLSTSPGIYTYTLRANDSNVCQEVKARKGKIIAIVTEGDTQVKELADHVIEIPNTDENLVPLLATIPLQLLAYYVAVLRGCNVDQPRNLAKSVTVE
jgi:hypothetical protein